MQTAFTVLRALIGVPLTIVLMLALVLGGSVGVVTYKLADRETSKQWLVEGDVYKDAPEIVVAFALSRVDELAAEHPEEAAAPDFETLVARDELPVALGEVFTPAWLQEETEGVIDSTYDFLEGESATLNVAINIAPVRERGQEVLADLFTRRLSQLPTCADDVGAQDFDLFTAECVPSGVSRGALNERIEREVQNISFFQDDTLTLADTEIKSADIENIRTVYPMVRYGIFILFGAALLTTLLLYWVLPGRAARRNVLRGVWVGSGLLLVGIAGAALLGFSFLVGQIILPTLSPSAAEIIEAARPFLSIVYHDLFTTIAIVGAIIAAVGAAFTFLVPPEREFRAQEVVGSK